MPIFRQNSKIRSTIFWGFVIVTARCCFGQDLIYQTSQIGVTQTALTPSFESQALISKRLPALDTEEESSLYADMATELAVEETLLDGQPSETPAMGDGMMGGMMGGTGKGLGFKYNFLPGGGENGLGLHQTRLDVGFMLPTRRMPPLMISGQFGVSFLDAPEVLRLPSQVYLTSVGIGMPLPITERTMLMLNSDLRMSGEFNANQLQYSFMGMGMFRLSDRTSLMASGGFKLLCDISEVDAQEFEPIVMVMGQFRRSESLSFMAGAAYLGSDSPWPMMPMVGLKWTPRDDFYANLMMPAPRIAYRVAQRNEGQEWWAYLGGGLGGDYWYLKRPDGMVRAVRYSQFTLALGIERQRNGTAAGSLEVGYAVGRAIEIDDEDIDYELDPTLSVTLSIRR